MSKELIVSAGRHETRVAIIEDDQVAELFYERDNEYSLAGSIHKGRVTRVLPGMQSAFVDIGLERDAFLYVSDFFEDNDEYEAVVNTVEDKVLKMERGGPQPERAPMARQAGAGSETEESLPAPAEGVEISEAAAAERPELIARESVVRDQPAREQVARPDGRTSDRGPDRGGDRGGDKARRGRRRRGGRQGGLPDAKYFSPRGGAPGGSTPAGQTASAPPPATVEREPEGERTESPRYSRPEHVRTEHVRTEQPGTDDDFVVLPGESLAKYAGDDAAETFGGSGAGLAVATEPIIEPTPESAIEAALPGEHPLAGLGMTSFVPLSEPIAEKQPEQEAAPAPAPIVADVDSDGSEGPGEGLSATEVTETELVDEIVHAQSDEQSANEQSADNQSTDSEEQPAEAAAAEDEGPEPARIPTSLTATLREQGHRYPHRASRRMRRRERGGEGGANGGPGGEAQGGNRERRPAEHSNAQTQNVEAPADGDTRIVTTPEAPVSRGERGGERGDRRPDGRERGERRPDGRERASGERTDERPERERPVLPSISDLLKEGQEIVVQIAKEPLGQKGARITSHIALPGRFVVYMPTVEHVGVSRKIPSDEERHRLKRVLQTHRQGVPGGFICRTAAEGKTEEELRVDMHFLYNLWLDMRQKAEKKPAPVLLHHDLNVVQRILRDQLTTSFKTIWVDNEELYESVLRFVERFQPALVGRVKLYTRSNPIFDEFGITAEVDKALRPKVWLKSGGHIVINQTEALVAIDINTGKYVGKSNRLEDTIVKVNTDAIKEIVRQIRLRDLGGIIVVDFIDMDERKNRQKVMQALEEGMRADRAPYKILQFNDFGLVAITRKRVKQSLERALCAPCSYCEGAGYIKSVPTVISEILREAARMQKALATETGNVMLRVNPEVAKVLKSNHNTYLQEIEEIVGRTVMVKSDPLLHQTKFDLA
jgi:ribonuclease G